VAELKGEKIDVIEWSENPAVFVANSLSPAKVLAVSTNEEYKIARVIVPNSQLSLAIGREGQNARLAARITGWKIDIKSEAQYLEMVAEAEALEAARREQEYGYDEDELAESEYANAGSAGAEEFGENGDMTDGADIEYGGFDSDTDEEAESQAAGGQHVGAGNQALHEG